MPRLTWSGWIGCSKEKAVSDQQYEQVKLAYDAAGAQLDQAQAAVNLAQHSLDVSIMKAPFAGVIASKNAEVGDVINPMMGGSPPAPEALSRWSTFPGSRSWSMSPGPISPAFKGPGGRAARHRRRTG